MVRLSCVLSRQLRTFIDSIRISVRGGRGGSGLPKYGGVGGKGGDIYAEAVEKYTLKELKIQFPTQKFIGGTGGNSRRFQILGSPGEDVVIKCPPGITAVSDKHVIGDLNKAGERLFLVRGGCGGGPQNGYIGQKGQAYPLTLDLKLLADVGFVGYPNAGKSTLLSALSNAKPKIGSYPFTTVSPSIGLLCYEDFRQITAADLPGLIEGAHFNYGMGHKFLKHCMRTKILLFVVDIDGFRLNPNMPHRSAFESIIFLNKELELYDEELLLKPAILAVNKTDMDSDQTKFEKLKTELKYWESNLEKFSSEMRPTSLIKFDAVIPISAKEGTNIPILKNKIRTVIDIYQEKRQVRYIEGDTTYEDSKEGVIYV